MTGPLHGLRVLDLTRILAGPTCTQILGDLGADIIKVEQAGSGDDTRRFAPPFIKDHDGKDTAETAYFCSANRNKRSMTLNVAKEEGQDLARRLANCSDVLVENFKFGGLAKYGLSYDQLKDENPGLVYCSISGFGHTGPYAERPGYDVLIQAMGGFMSITGDPAGEPQKAGIPIADLMAGMYASVSINAALRHREKTGEGQHIDIGMLDTMAATLSIMGANYLSTGDVPQQLGNVHPNIVPYQVFATNDGKIVLAAANDAQYQRFCEFAGVPELAGDEKYISNELRVRNRKQWILRWVREHRKHGSMRRCSMVSPSTIRRRHSPCPAWLSVGTSTRTTPSFSSTSARTPAGRTGYRSRPRTSCIRGDGPSRPSSRRHMRIWLSTSSIHRPTTRADFSSAIRRRGNIF